MDEPIVAIEANEIVAMQSKKVFMVVASKMKFSIFEIITENGQINLKNIQITFLRCFNKVVMKKYFWIQ